MLVWLFSALFEEVGILGASKEHHFCGFEDETKLGYRIQKATKHKDENFNDASKFTDQIDQTENFSFVDDHFLLDEDWYG